MRWSLERTLVVFCVRPSSEAKTYSRWLRVPVPGALIWWAHAQLNVTQCSGYNTVRTCLRGINGFSIIQSRSGHHERLNLSSEEMMDWVVNTFENQMCPESNVQSFGVTVIGRVARPVQSLAGTGRRPAQPGTKRSARSTCPLYA